MSDHGRIGKSTHRSVSIKGDRFDKQGRIKEEVLVTFNPVDGTLFLHIEGAKIDKQYSLPLDKVREKLMPLLAEGYLNLAERITLVQDAGFERAPIIPPGPGRPGGPETGLTLPGSVEDPDGPGNGS